MQLTNKQFNTIPIRKNSVDIQSVNNIKHTKTIYCLNFSNAVCCVVYSAAVSEKVKKVIRLKEI